MKSGKQANIKPNISIKRKLLFILVVILALLSVMTLRVLYLMTFEADELQRKAYEQQTRDRLITPNRGAIYDRNLNALATTETVASVSVIHAQVKDKEGVAKTLADILGLDYNTVLEKVSKRVALERIAIKVDKETADKIRALNLAGVVVDEDVKRVYPYAELAAQVIGFVGRDNQGIIGLEAKYDSYLRGSAGKILTQTDARGIELPEGDVIRVAPEDGLNLVTTIDVTLQSYAEQAIRKVVQYKNAKRGLIVLMNPQNGEILALANEPTFDLNEPFTINRPELAAQWDMFSSTEQMDYLNNMWRNFAINDTFEPGSTFKIVTSAAGLQAGVVTPTTGFV